MKKILVAVDETESSTRAAEFVNDFFTGDDVDIVAINVAREPVDTLPPVPFGGLMGWRWPLVSVYDPTETMDAERAAREAQAERVVSQQAPPTAGTEVVFGDPVEAICRAADDEDVDLIVVGSNDKGFLDRLFGGSVSQELARKAPRPVLVVR